MINFARIRNKIHRSFASLRMTSFAGGIYSTIPSTAVTMSTPNPIGSSTFHPTFMS
jgi:hypothetical protein